MRDHGAAQAFFASALRQQQALADQHGARSGQRLNFDIDAGKATGQQRQRSVHPNCASTKPCSALAMSGSSVSARVIVISQLSRGVTPSRISTPA